LCGKNLITERRKSEHLVGKGAGLNRPESIPQKTKSYANIGDSTIINYKFFKYEINYQKMENI
jgi:hypothetical protein